MKILNKLIVIVIHIIPLFAYVSAYSQNYELEVIEISDKLCIIKRADSTGIFKDVQDPLYVFRSDSVVFREGGGGYLVIRNNKTKKQSQPLSQYYGSYLLADILDIDNKQIAPNNANKAVSNQFGISSNKMSLPGGVSKLTQSDSIRVVNNIKNQVTDFIKKNESVDSNFIINSKNEKSVGISYNAAHSILTIKNSTNTLYYLDVLHLVNKSCMSIFSNVIDFQSQYIIKPQKTISVYIDSTWILNNSFFVILTENSIKFNKLMQNLNYIEEINCPQKEPLIIKKITF